MSTTRSPHKALFDGERIVLTGRLAAMPRAEAKALIESGGGAVVSSISGRTTMLVIGGYGWPVRRDGGLSVKVEQAERLRARGGAIRIVSEQAFLEQAGLRSRERIGRKTFPPGHVASAVGVDELTVRRWEQLGLVRASDDGDFDFQDIVSLQTVASLVADGVRPDAIRATLERLRTLVPGADRPLAQLKIVTADTGDLVAQLGGSLIASDGQHLLNFDAPTRAQPGADRLLVEPKPLTSGDAMERALRFEEEEQYEDAANAYRHAIALEPRHPEGYFNLGNALRMAGRVEAAEEMYRVSLAIDPRNELAWYNLGDVLEEGGRVREAVESLRRAIEVRPDFADAHFNLAICLDSLGDDPGSRRHWRAYLELDPSSEWASIAREHLARSS